MNQSITLNHSSTGFHGLIIQIDGDKNLKKKLMSLGLRKGQEVSVLHQRKNGVVVFSNGSRIAVGESIASHILLKEMTES